ncbi:MAG: alcohol dehydrogenase, partial [Thaumarchaeota archaeon]
MRALYFDGKKLELREDYPIPERRIGEALIRVRYAGICGTDLEI